MKTAMTTVAALTGVTLVALNMMSGCRISLTHPVGFNSSPKVSKADLEYDISRRLTAAGQVPLSVSCPGDLVGTLGQSTRCEVTLSQANSFEPVVTVTGLEGTKVDYDITVSVSKSQLEGSVAQMMTNAGKAVPQAVICQSGLDGKVGAVAYCDVTAGGVTSRRTVEVSDVSGLGLRYGLVPALDRAVVASSLVSELRQIGQRPESATCAGDLEGTVGTRVACSTLTAGHNKDYTVTVTAVDGGKITYNYAPTT
jgi:Domain of unknown function (DUF4333)